MKMMAKSVRSVRWSIPVILGAAKDLRQRLPRSFAVPSASLRAGFAAQDDAARHFFLVLLFFDDFFLGTFAPDFRASERPMAMACLRLVTFLPERPLLSVPRFRSCIARLTFFDAFLLYLRAMRETSCTSRCASGVRAYSVASTYDV